MILARMGTTGEVVGSAVVGDNVGILDSVGERVGSSVGLIGSGVCPCIHDRKGGEKVWGGSKISETTHHRYNGTHPNLGLITKKKQNIPPQHIVLTM